MYYVYLLQSEDKKKIYVGMTEDLRRRFKEHNSKANRGYTKNKRWRLVYYEAYLSKKDALLREKRLKQDGRAKRALLNRIKESLLET